MIHKPEILEFKLDLDKWICGKGQGFLSPDSYPVINSLGKGETSLLNPQGFMCCLGQFCTQHGVDLLPTTLVGTPEDLSKNKIDLILNSGLVDSNEITYPNYKKTITNSLMSSRLIDINDDPGTAINTKLTLMRKELESNGLRLLVLKDGTRHPLSSEEMTREQMKDFFQSIIEGKENA